MRKIKLFFGTVVLLSSYMNFGQPIGHWRCGGNPGLGLDAATPVTNFLGTDITNPGTPIRFGTGGVNQMFLNTNGFFGIGNIFPGTTVPQSLLHIHDGNASFLQVTNGATVA
jgi:hypothetical protein